MSSNQEKADQKPCAENSYSDAPVGEEQEETKDIEEEAVKEFLAIANAPVAPSLTSKRVGDTDGPVKPCQLEFSGNEEEEKAPSASAASRKLGQLYIAPADEGKESPVSATTTLPSTENSSTTRDNATVDTSSESLVVPGGFTPPSLQRQARPLATPGAFHMEPGGRPAARPPMQGNLATVDDYSNSTIDNTTTASRSGLSSRVFAATLVEDVGDDNNGSTQRNPRHLGRSSVENPATGTAEDVVVAEAFKEVEDRLSRRGMIMAGFGVLVLSLVVVFLALGLAGVDDNKSSSLRPPSHNQSSHNGSSHDQSSTALDPLERLTTLERIEQEGVVKFGHPGITPGLFFPDENNEFKGFIAEMYNAIASALGAKAEYVNVPKPYQFQALANGTFDVMISGFVHKMQDEVYQEDAKQSFAFSYPYGYTGIQIGGDPFYVECIDNGFQHLDNCSGVKLCFGDGTIVRDVFEKYLPSRYTVMRNGSIDDIVTGFVEGECNVMISADAYFISPPRVIEAGYNGSYTVGRSMFRVDPQCAVTRVDDPYFSDFVSAVIQSIKVAEKFNITQNTAKLFPPTNVFGERYRYMFQNVISAVGSYPEILLRSLGITKSRIINRINDGSTGLLLSHPLGNVEVIRDDTPSTLVERKTLKCGVVPNRPGFVEKTDGGTYAGMDVDFCRALAASLFFGDDDNVKFLELHNASQGFQQLASGELDVFAGATWTLENDVREPTTGMGFSFSKPYFYGYSRLEDNFCLATRQDDPDWSAFVYWVVMATIFAEENGIDETSSNEMPEVFVFGPEHNRMFRDALWAVGNYGEIYSRNIGNITARGGRNVLNVFPNQGPQSYIIPGFV